MTDFTIPNTGDIVIFEELENIHFKVGVIIKGGMGVVYQLLPIGNLFKTKAAKTFLRNVDKYIFKKEAEN